MGKERVDEPGPVTVVTPEPSLSISCLTSAKSAISMAKAIKVNSAAKNASRDATRVMTRWVESAKTNATNVTMVATPSRNSVR